MKVGDKVHYQPEHYGVDYENGIVKEIPDHTDEAVRVVYNCNNDWDNYREYTSALTNLKDLKDGWTDRHREQLKNIQALCESIRGNGVIVSCQHCDSYENPLGVAISIDLVRSKLPVTDIPNGTCIILDVDGSIQKYNENNGIENSAIYHTLEYENLINLLRYLNKEK